MRMILSCFCLLLSATAPPLEQICPVEWRGVAVSTAFEHLQGRFRCEVAVRSDVERARLQQEVRLSASHLTGKQVFQWLARLSLLNVIFSDGSVIIVPADQAAGADVNAKPVWPATATRRMRLQWKDTPLSRVAADISTSFEIDVIFDGPVLADAGLVTLEFEDMDLQAVSRELARQLQATVDFIDGALWVHRRVAEKVIRVADKPDPMPETVRPAPPAGPKPASPLAKPVSVTPSVSNWREWGERLSQAAGCPILMEIPEGSAYPAIEAQGLLLDILEAGRILGLFSWSAEPIGAGRDFSVRIRVHESS